MTIKVINILPEPPAYEAFDKEFRPEVRWDTQNGSWVGIWDEWPDQLGREILKITNEFEYEVWQPDLRVSRTYSHVFENGLTHKLFPAKNKKKICGIKIENEIYSEHIIFALEQSINSNSVIVNLNGNLCSFLNKGIIEMLKNQKIVFTFHGEINLPSTRFFSFAKNFPSKINLLLEHLWIIKHINKMHYITYQNDRNLNSLKKIYKGKLEKITMGCDFSFWHKLDKNICRRELTLPFNKFIMITAALFVNRKQIDKFIKVLTELSSKHDFLYLVIGSGDKKYENYLHETASPLLEKEKIQFLDYTRGETLLKYLNSADLFITSAVSEGGPVSAMEAFACELPVFSTKTGNTAELMERENVKCLVRIKNYNEWGQELEKILESKQLPKALNREIARSHYDWENIAKKFIRIYKNLV